MRAVEKQDMINLGSHSGFGPTTWKFLQVLGYASTILVDCQGMQPLKDASGAQTRTVDGTGGMQADRAQTRAVNRKGGAQMPISFN